MGEITLHAGWEGDAIIGKVFVQEIRGKENFSFEYDREWLKKHVNFVLDPDIENREGMQYPPSGKKTFGFLSDVSPDRWGKKLIQRFFAENSGAVSGQRREQRDLFPTAPLGRRKILESDYILGVSDKTRQGGVRLSENGVFLSSSGNSVPPITSLRELEEASMQLEKHEGNISEILHKLLFPGSSLGGARPKANVADVDGSLWIAKFPSRYDEVDVGAWEMVIHDLAKKCGLNVPTAKLIKLSENRSTFLSKRFDRDEQGNRIHFASAMTMLGEVDGSDNLKSYLDIADFIDKQKSNTYVVNLHELWKRVVFNICVSNTDDHLRNHGFLLNPQNDLWELSPAYDINPSPDDDWMELAIDFDNTSKDLMCALDTCLYYHIEEDTAVEEIARIQKVVRENWAQLASRYGIPKREQERMERAFLRSYNEIKALENIMNSAPIVGFDFEEGRVQSTGGARSAKYDTDPDQGSGLCGGKEDLLDFLNDSANDSLGLGESDRPGTAVDEMTEVPKKGIDLESP